MAEAEINPWLSKFDRESGFKSSIILFGNTNDIYYNPYKRGKYEPFLDIITECLFQKGYKNIVKWDRVSGLSESHCSIKPKKEIEENSNGEEYDIGLNNEEIDKTNKITGKYKSLDEFFPYLFKSLNHKNTHTAFILDYSDYLFGNANSLSEKERDYLATLGKSLNNGQSYNILNVEEFSSIGNIVILVAHNNATIPPYYYVDNPLVSTINVSLPSRHEREKFIRENASVINILQNIDDSSSSEFDDFVDALDNYSLKEISQIMKLSRQLKEKMSFEKLINLYKYGEKVSPWEELSKDKLSKISERLGERVKGQDQAIAKVKDVIIRAFTGFAGLQHSSKQKKPKGALFFVGPTGVGKTELAKSLAEFIFGDEGACIRFDMSEYNHEHSDQRLVGAPPGYVGYEAGGQLTNSIKDKPFCVLLFDEIEKAHGRILDKFLQILEDGRLTDGKGETVYFSEAIIIFTSNIGAADISSDLPQKEANSKFIEAVKDHFINELGRPELLNRIGDNIVAFNFIDNPEVFTSIAKTKFETVVNFVNDKYNATIRFDDEDKSFLAIGNKAGKQNGGRGLLNVMESVIINPLSEFIFERLDMLAGRTIVVNLEDEKRCLFDFELE